MSNSIFDSIDSSLNPETIQSMLTFDIDNEEVFEIANNVSYSGFNPIITFNICMKLIGRDDDRKKSLITLIVFGLTRGFGGGKTLNDIMNRTKEEGKEDLLSAMTLFRIKFVNDRSNNTITISRILVAFPVLTYKVHEQLMVSGLKKPSDYEGDLPMKFQYPGSPSMMANDTWEEEKLNYLGYCEYLSDLWNKTFDYDETYKFAELSYKSPLSPVESRI